MSSVFPPGLQLGTRYRVLRLIEDNRIGALFEAENLTTHDRVALKWLRFSAARAPHLAQQFAERARAASRLRHPNRAHIHDVTHEGNAVFVVSELLPGESLRARLAPHEMLLHERLHVLAQAMRAVVDAHQRGLVHGGLHPGNIFLQREHDAWLGLPALTKVLDFGTSTHGLLESLARPSDWSELGAHAFLDYEQLSSDSERDPRSDIYAFGALLYHALTGHMPFPAKSPLELALKQTTTVATRVRILHPALPASLDDLIAGCLLRTRAERPRLDLLAEETSAYAALCSSREVMAAGGPNTRPMNHPPQRPESAHGTGSAHAARGHTTTGRTTVKLSHWDVLALLKEQARQTQARASEELVSADPVVTPERRAVPSAAPERPAVAARLRATVQMNRQGEADESHQDEHERARSAALSRPVPRARGWLQTALAFVLLAGLAAGAGTQLAGGSELAPERAVRTPRGAALPPGLPTRPRAPAAPSMQLDARELPGPEPELVAARPSFDRAPDGAAEAILGRAAEAAPPPAARAAEEALRSAPRRARPALAHVARAPQPAHDDSYLVGAPPKEDEF